MQKPKPGSFVSLSLVSRALLIPLGMIMVIGTHSSGLAAPPEDPLNVVLILADDLGWSDTTLFGHTRLYQTPNLQRLAQRGMLFSRAYSASPLCSPTRASILTGLSPARIGITAPNCHLKEVRLKPAVMASAPANDKSIGCISATRLVTDYQTLPVTLHRVGYATGHFGKWHLGHEPYDALHHGFDVDVPHWPGPGPAGSYVAPWKFPSFLPRMDHEHIEDRIGDEAVQFLRKNKDQPFLLNYWQFSVHAPFDAKQALIDAYRPCIDPQDPQRSPTYAAMVQSLDENVGKILDTLEQLQLAERTIVIFYSDNGGNMYNEVDGTTPTSNAPLRGGKATMYEGGIRVPCIICWPGVVAGSTTCDTPIQSTDLYPTLLDMLGLPVAQEQQFDGRSLAGLLRGDAASAQSLQQRELYTFFPHSPKVPDFLPPSVCMHQGPWKLIRVFHDGEDGQHRYELYNLDDDLGERRNLAAQYPDLLRQLDAKIETFLQDCHAVVPIRNPAYDPQVAVLAQQGLTGVNNCTLRVKDGQLIMEATNGDPHFTLKLTEPTPTTALVVQLSMRSSVSDTGHVYWQQPGVTPAFDRDRRAEIPVRAGEQLQEYQISLPVDRPVSAIRLDPLNKPGTVQLDQVQLKDNAGNVLQVWTFD